MHSTHAGKGLQRFHHLNRDGDALGLGVARLLQAVEHLRTDGEARDLGEPLRLVRRAKNEHAGGHRPVAGSPGAHPAEPATEGRGVDARLRRGGVRAGDGTTGAAGMEASAARPRLLRGTWRGPTRPWGARAGRRTPPAAGLFGGLSSAVTTNAPDLRRLASALKRKDLSFYL